MAAGLTLGLSSQAAPVPSASDKFLRWGLIGVGARGYLAHLPVIKSLPDMQILGICDVTESNLNRALVAAPGARGYADYQKLLADPDINAVLIATPGCFHCEMVMAALQAGKHVMAEKPMGLNLEQGKAMKRAADASDRTVLYTTQLRYSPYYQEVRKQIEAGRIGEPKHMLFQLYRPDWNHKVWQYADPKTGKSINWRFSHAASGGPLLEEGCHYYDILHWMAGALPQRVYCQGGIACYTTDGRDTWDHAVTTLKYGNGCLGTLDLCLFGPTHLELQVVGEGGCLHAVIESHSLLFEPRGRGKKEELKLPDEVMHGVTGPSRGLETAVVVMYNDFVDSIKQHKKPWVDSEKAFNACKTSWLGELSAQRKQEVDWADLV